MYVLNCVVVYVYHCPWWFLKIVIVQGIANIAELLQLEQKTYLSRNEKIYSKEKQKGDLQVYKYVLTLASCFVQVCMLTFSKQCFGIYIA